MHTTGIPGLLRPVTYTVYRVPSQQLGSLGLIVWCYVLWFSECFCLSQRWFHWLDFWSRFFNYKGKTSSLICIYVSWYPCYILISSCSRVFIPCLLPRNSYFSVDNRSCSKVSIQFPLPSLTRNNFFNHTEYLLTCLCYEYFTCHLFTIGLAVVQKMVVSPMSWIQTWLQWGYLFLFWKIGCKFYPSLDSFGEIFSIFMYMYMYKRLMLTGFFFNVWELTVFLLWRTWKLSWIYCFVRFTK